MKKICVFCGSSAGKSESYVNSARSLGADFAKNGIGLVYGGASIGVMGAIANGCLENGGKVWGVIPQSIIDLEVGHQNLTGLEVVEDMHTRKARMYELSDAFFALPGGFGTLDELCEIMTWTQLGYHQKPCYIINENGFFDYLLQHFHHANKEGFVSDEHMKIFIECKSVDQALNDFKQR